VASSISPSRPYLKDDGEFKKYLLARGLEKKRLRLGPQRTLEGAPLAQALEKVIAFQEYLNRFEKRGLARKVVRLLLDHGVVSKESLRQEEGLQSVLQALNATENLTARLEFDEEHTCWALLVTTHGREAVEIRLDWELLGSSDFQALVRLDQQDMVDFKSPPHSLEGKDKTWDFADLDQLLTFVMEEGQKGITIQRFKGLGEMNPEQLWETTMDPETRTLLKVNIADAGEADYIFNVLMGDKVEPRRDFIQNNVLELNELDI
jgi:DNA gyrase subunit B